MAKGDALTPPDPAAPAKIPFHTYLWKIASRCNIDCSYCYVYHSVDQIWRTQPKFMSRRVAERTAARMVEHLKAHGRTRCSIIFHGGEPLMGGRKHLEMLVGVIHDAFAGSGIGVSIGLQTNLLLMTEDIADFLVANRISIGVSLDGPPDVNDRHRRDHQGRPTSSRLEEKLALIRRPEYKSIFGGFLCVIDPATDAREVTRYLLSFEPIGIDFLLPLDNHDRLPVDKRNDRSAAGFGDWLAVSYDTWLATPNVSRIRFFQSIVNMMCGAPSLVEALGLNPVDLIVIEANGDIEGVDSLKTTFEGATNLGFHIDRNGFDEVADHVAVRSRQLGATSLATECQRCSLVTICGGGYLPHRYSSSRGFDNPSVYCADLKRLILHINGSVQQAVAPVVKKAKERARMNGFTSTTGMARSHAPIIQQAKSALGSTANAAILDLGCGSGILALSLSEELEARPFGVEIDALKARYARRLLTKRGGAAWHGSIFDDRPSWIDRRYDLAILPVTALVEAPDELKQRLRSHLTGAARSLVIYAYDDDRRRWGSLETIADRAGLRLCRPVEQETAALAEFAP